MIPVVVIKHYEGSQTHSDATAQLAAGKVETDVLFSGHPDAARG
jgi:hypothetical protein